MSRKLALFLLAALVALGFVVGPQWGRPSSQRGSQAAAIWGEEPAASSVGVPRDSGDEPIFPVKPELHEPAILDLPVIDEILEIRRQQGELLKGTLLEHLEAAVEEGAAVGQEHAASFQEALRRVAANDPRASSDRGPAHPSVMPAAPDADIEVLLVESLRRTCRLLARRAELLEDRKEYAAADRLRRLSARLRRESRLLDSP